MDLFSVEVFSTRFLMLVFLLTGAVFVFSAVFFLLRNWVSYQRAQLVAAFFLFAQLVFLVWGAVVSGFVEPSGWALSWVPPLATVGAIDIGLLENKPALLVAAVPFLLGLLSLLRTSRVCDPADGNKFLLGLVLSSFGAGLAWLGSSAWAVLPAVFLTLMGALFGAGKSIQSEKEERYFGGFLGRQHLGLGVTTVGLAALAGGGVTLVFMKADSPVGVTSGLSVFGIATVLLGLVLLFGGVPTGLWNEMEGDAKRSSRFILFQIYIGFSVMALAARLEPLFRESQVFKYVSWFVFSISALLLVVGLFQKRKASALGIWLVSGGLLSISALGLGGSHDGILLFLATALTAYSVLVEPLAKPVRWVILILGGGLIGTISASAWLGWISAQIQETVVPGFLVALLFGLKTVLFSKVVLLAAADEGAENEVWYSWVPVSVALLLQFALFWQGSVVGGMIPEFSDHLFEGLLGSSQRVGTQNQPVALAAFLSSWLIFISIGVWLARAQANVWEKMQETLPRVTAFIIGGFGIDKVLLKATLLLGRMSDAIERGVEKRITNELAPVVVEKCLQTVAGVSLKISESVTVVLEGAVKNAVSAPSQIVRLIQSGSIQWYLLFGFLVGMTIFMHFILSAGVN